MAIVIWFCSLPMRCIVLYSDEQVPGYLILVLGWLSPLLINFAWFANIFFLKGVLQLKSGKTATKSSIFAVILSLDTFRLTQYTLSEAGGATPVYGYGWGAALWFLSIIVLMAAAGLRNHEEGEAHDWLLSSSIILFVVLFGMTTYFATHDRMIANLSETKRLAGIAFKRGNVCTAPEPLPIEPIRNFSGPLEVIVDPNGVHAQFPFGQIKYLLEWGIPVVRVNHRDYSMNQTSHGPELVSVPEAGAPSAILTVTEDTSFEGVPHTRSIHAKLVNSSNRTVFDQVWNREPLPNVEHNYYCPDYESFPGENEQPRLLLIKALNLTEADSRQDVRDHQKINGVAGTVVGHADGGLTREMRFAQWKKTHPETNVPAHETFNTNCPDDIGWDDTGFESRLNTGRPFMVREKAYYLRPGSHFSYHATCAGDFAYLYTGSAEQGKYYLNVQKRTLPDFRQIWAGIVIIHNIPAEAYENMLRIQSVQEADSSVTLELANEKTGKIMLVKAPLHDDPLR